MNITPLNEQVAVGGPPTADDDVRDLASRDFQSILNLRTDVEDDGYSSREEGVSANEAGLVYLNYPLGDGALDDFHISAFRTKLSLLPAPTYVHAGNSPRAAALVLIDHAIKQQWSADEALNQVPSLGLPELSGKWESVVREAVAAA